MELAATSNLVPKRAVGNDPLRPFVRGVRLLAIATDQEDERWSNRSTEGDSYAR